MTSTDSRSRWEFDVAVIGIGYVGLPLAVAAAAAGLNVLGYDTNSRVIRDLSSGRSHVGDVSDDHLRGRNSARLTFTDDESKLKVSRVIVICVPTPLDLNGRPDLSAVEAAGVVISRNLSPGTLIVLESTTYPGTTEEILCPILARSGFTPGLDIFVAYSPERVDPGNQTYGIENTPKIVGGITPESSTRASDFYSLFVETVVQVAGTREAEMAKLLENTYRHVNIALVNEMAMFSHDLGINIWEVIRAASTKPFGFQAFYPGPGVGGHCIPIDPNYLSHKVRELGYPFRFVELAQEISSRMPHYVVDRASGILNENGKPLNGSNIVLYGVTYKKDIADTRESPSKRVAELLAKRGAKLGYVDPYVETWLINGENIPRAFSPRDSFEPDLLILLQSHSEFDLASLQTCGIPILDTRGVIDGDLVSRL